MINLTKWNVWNNYTSYFIGDINLDEIQFNIVESGLCQLAYNSKTNQIVWENEKEIMNDVLEIDRRKYVNKGKIKFPEGLADYSLECAYQAGAMRFFENKLFSEFVIKKNNYVRGFADVIIVQLESTKIFIYPQFKIWENGVFSVLLRIISPNKSINEDFLIDNYVNLYRHDTSKIYLPPEILYLYSLDYFSHYDLSFWRISKLKKQLYSYRELIQANTITLEDTEFKFAVCPVNIQSEDIVDGCNLMTIVDYLFSSLSASLNKTYLGKNKNKNVIGDYWSGRPQVIIIDFENNNNLASLNHEKYQFEFSKILSRTTDMTNDLRDKTLHKSYRNFDDYSSYLNEGLGLWVYSQKGLELNKDSKDPNSGDLISPLQVKAELMDYFYLTCKKLYELAKKSPVSFNRLVELKADYFTYNEIRNKCSTYGEINEIFFAFFEKMNLQTTEKAFVELVELKKEIEQIKRAKLYQSTGLILSLVFGLIGALSFSKEIIVPFWTEFGLWMPLTEAYRNLFFFGTSSVLLLTLVYTLFKLFKRK